MPTIIKDEEAKRRISFKAASLIKSQDSLALGPGAMAGGAFKALIEGRGGACAPTFLITNSFLITGVDIPRTCYGIKVIGRAYSDQARAFIDDEVVEGFTDRDSLCNNAILSVAGLTFDHAARGIDIHCPPKEAGVIRALINHPRSHLIVMCSYSLLGTAVVPRVSALDDILKDRSDKVTVSFVTNHEQEWDNLSQEENPGVDLTAAADMLKALRLREKKFENFHLEFAKEEDVDPDILF